MGTLGPVDEAFPDEPDVLATHYVRWPPPDGDIVVELTWARVGGRVDCVRVGISSGCRIHDGDIEPELSRFGEALERQAITTSMVRSIPFGTIIDDRRREVVARFTKDLDERDLSVAAPGFRSLIEAWSGQASPPRGDWAPDHWAEVARIYTAAWRSGDGEGSQRRPTKAVQEHFNVSKSTAAKWVAKCRNELGLLGPTTKGRPAGPDVREKEEA